MEKRLKIHPDIPILVIGSGVPGLETLMTLKKMIVTRCAGREREERAFGIAPSNVELLGIDTGLERRGCPMREELLPLSETEKRVFSVSDEFRSALEHPENMPEAVSSWLDPALYPDLRSLAHGDCPDADRNRQIGRLFLMWNIEDVVCALRDKIEAVTDGFDRTAALYVFIVSGLSDGAGGGTFIDVPYLVRKAASELCSQRPVRVTGLFFLPEVIYCSYLPFPADRKSDQRNRNLANGFAALKELDYLMALGNTGDVFEQEYGACHITSFKEPYDACVLLTGEENSDGKSAAYLAADTIFTWICEDSREQRIRSMPRIAGWLPNECARRTVYQRMCGDRRLPVGYFYTLVDHVSRTWPQISRGMFLLEMQSGIPCVDESQITVKMAVREKDRVIWLYNKTLARQMEVIWKNFEKAERVLCGLESAGKKNGNTCGKPYRVNENPVDRIAAYRLDFTCEMEMCGERVHDLEQEAEAAHEKLCKTLFKNRGFRQYMDSMERLYAAKRNYYLYERITFLLNHIEQGLAGYGDFFCGETEESADFLLEILARIQGRTLDTFAEDIIKWMKEKMRVYSILDPKYTSEPVDFPECLYITCPEKPANRLKAFEAAQYMEDQYCGTECCGTEDRVSLHLFVSAVPLCALRPLKQYNQAYTEYRDKIAGLHLYMPGNTAAPEGGEFLS